MVDQLFVMDPLPGVDPDHDTTYVIMRETQRRSRDCWVAQSRDLEVNRGTPCVKARRVDVLDTGESHYRDRESARRPLADFEGIWMREDPPFDRQYLYATYLLDRAPVPVWNDPTGIRDSNEKLFILEFPDRIPPTWVGSHPERVRSFLREVGGEGVGKTLAGYGGEEVYRLSLGDSNLGSLLEELTLGGERTIMVQEFLPAVQRTGDRRVILLGGEPIGAITRLPPEGDFRANLHSGGSARPGGVTDEERAIARELQPELLDRGLHLVGLDLIEDQITEINVTSPTCVQEINELHDVRLEEQIVDYVLNQTESDTR